MPEYIPPLFFKSRARAYRATSVQSIPNTTNTIVQLNAKDYDTLGEMTIVNPWKFTAQKAGFYLIIAQLHYVSMADGKVVIVGIRKNGVCIGETYAHTGLATDQHVVRVDIQYLAAGDYIQEYAWHNNGAAVDLAVGSALTFLSIYKLSE